MNVISKNLGILETKKVWHAVKFHLSVNQKHCRNRQDRSHFTFSLRNDYSTVSVPGFIFSSINNNSDVCSQVEKKSLSNLIKFSW